MLFTHLLTGLPHKEPNGLMLLMDSDEYTELLKAIQ